MANGLRFYSTSVKSHPIPHGVQFHSSTVRSQPIAMYRYMFHTCQILLVPILLVVSFVAQMPIALHLSTPRPTWGREMECNGQERVQKQYWWVCGGGARRTSATYPPILFLRSLLHKRLSWLRNGTVLRDCRFNPAQYNWNRISPAV